MNFGRGLYFFVFVIFGGKWDGEVVLVVLVVVVVVVFNLLVVRSVVGCKSEGEAKVVV